MEFNGRSLSWVTPKKNESGRAYEREVEIVGITVNFLYRVLRGMLLKQGPFAAILTRARGNNSKGTYRVSARGKGDGLHVMIRYNLPGPKQEKRCAVITFPMSWKAYCLLAGNTNPQEFLIIGKIHTQ